MDPEKRRWDAIKIVSDMEKMNQEWTFLSSHNPSKKQGRSGQVKQLSLDDSITSCSSLGSPSVSMSKSCGFSHLKEISDALANAKELVDIVSHLLSQSNQPSSSAMSLITAINSEIDKACIQINELTAQEQIAEAKVCWKKKEQQEVEAEAMACTASELEAERKSRRESEIANQKLIEEVQRLRSELEHEKRAKKAMEEGEHGVKSSAFCKIMKQFGALVRRESNKQGERIENIEECRESGVSDLFSVQLNTHRKDTTLCKWHVEAERRSDCDGRKRGKSALLASRSLPAPNLSRQINEVESCSRFKLQYP